MKVNLFSCPLIYLEAPVDLNKIQTEFNGDWQSTWVRGDFDETTELHKLKKFIVDTAHTYFNDCGFKDIELRSTNVWLNDKGYGDYIHPHHHGMTLISWSYYLNTTDETGDIVFMDPKGNSSWSYFTPLQMHTDKVNGLLGYRLNPKPNHIVMFPGWLQHYVEPNKSNTIVRRSIAGDFHTKEFVDYYDSVSVHSQRDLQNHTGKPKEQLK
jgi:uncharacterized protein (TIGR02466 family)